MFRVYLILFSLLFFQVSKAQDDTTIINLPEKISILNHVIDSLTSVANSKIVISEIYTLINADEIQVSEFRNSVKNIEEKILKRIEPKGKASAELKSLQNNLISALPEFYLNVHITLEKLLKAWVYGYDKDYTVEPGDNLSKIAHKADSMFTWLSIYELNKKRIKNPDLIFPQQTLKVPYYQEKQDFQNDIPQVVDTLSIVTKDEKRTISDIEIEGLIVDQTLSKSGHDFYEIFYNKFEAPSNFKDYTITIIEKPFPARQSSQVSIFINETEIFRNYIQPRYEIIEELAQESVYVTLSFLENFDEIQKELQGDDLQGSGIF